MSDTDHDTEHATWVAEVERRAAERRRAVEEQVAAELRDISPGDWSAVNVRNYVELEAEAKSAYDAFVARAATKPWSKGLEAMLFEVIMRHRFAAAERQRLVCLNYELPDVPSIISFP